MLKILPDKGLIKDRISFFHSNVNLNNRFFIASDNILNLNRSTDCVLAEYEEREQEPVILMIVRYPDKAAAETAHESFCSGYMPDAAETGLAEMENQLWTMVKQRENIVAIIFDAPDTARAQELFLEIQFE
jgi:HEAT repeat protein